MEANGFRTCCGAMMLEGFTSTYRPMTPTSKEELKKFLMNALHRHRSCGFFVATLNQKQFDNASDVFADCGFTVQSSTINRNSDHMIYLMVYTMADEARKTLQPYKEIEQEQLKSYWATAYT